MKKFPLVNRLLFAILAAAGASVLCAQTQNLSYTVSTDPPGASFTVDGVVYTSAAQFEWPNGSQHVVSFLQTQLPSGVVISPVTSTSQGFNEYQLSKDGATLYAFDGWVDNTSTLGPVQQVTQIITANPAITSITANVTVSYRVLLDFFLNPADSTPACATEGTSSVTRAGVIYVNGTCYWSNAIMYFPAGATVDVNGIPFPGFVFQGWSGLSPSNAYIQTYVLNGPVSFTPTFSAAKRVRVETKPLGLNVLVDHTPSPTLEVNPSNNTCPNGENQPLPAPANVAPLCFGDFDFAGNSSHLIGAPSPETDLKGKLWVFDSWSSASGQTGSSENAIYTADNRTSVSDLVTVVFDPGAQASFVTNPTGLQLSVDGRSNWPAYNFVWAQGSTHQVSAPTQQTDSTGRQWVFSGWSNRGAASQTLAVDQTAVNSGIRMIATYSELSRVVVQSNPPGQTIQVNGNACVTPCNVDQASGGTLHVVAPTSISAGPGVRLDFASWSDGGAADHVYTIPGNYQALTASYNTSYQLSASSSPANGANLVFSPTSPDTFYPSNAQVTITANPRGGFKFLRWGGDLSGTYPSGTLSMSTPHTVVAQMATIPYIAPAGVVNGAGTTPEVAVAPGSIVMILGESLATGTVIGPTNPLSQAVGNVSVTVADQLLPVFSVTPQQVTALLPSNLTNGNYTLVVHSQGQPDVSGNFTVTRDAPGVFTNPANSTAYILAFHADGSLVTSGSPARQGEQITFYGTGFGPYSSPVLDGFFPPNPPPTVADTVEIKAAGLILKPDWAGAAAGYTGLVEVKLTIGGGLPTATQVNLQVEINGVLSNTVVLPLQ